MRQSSKAWLALSGSVLAYEALCQPGETLSERLDPIVARPLGRLAIGAFGLMTVAHLINECPEPLDLWHKLGEFRHD